MIISIFFIGCNSSDSASSSTNTLDSNYKVVSSGYLDVNESSTKKFQFIYNQASFDETYKTYSSDIAPTIDFSKENVAILQLGYKTSKEYSIQVTNITEEFLYRIIHIETTVLDESCPKGFESVAPFEIISFTSEINDEFNNSYKSNLFEESVKVIYCDSQTYSTNFDSLTIRELYLGDTVDIAYDIESTFEVVQNQNVYEDYFYNHIKPIGTDKELPYVDFENETLIVLFLGERGYKMEVKSINEFSNHIEVSIERVIVDDFCTVETVETSPAVFLVIPKTQKEIIFKEYDNSGVCPVSLDDIVS
jgi:hypothetical protein